MECTRMRLRTDRHHADRYIPGTYWSGDKKVKGHPNIILTVGFESLMLYSEIQSHRFLSSGEVLYHIWAWWPSCSLVQNHLNKPSFEQTWRP